MYRDARRDARTDTTRLDKVMFKPNLEKCY